MSDVKFFETQKVSSLLFKFAVPSIIGLLSHALYNVCDRIFVGRGAGEIGLSAVTVVFPIMMVRFAFIMLVGAGTATLVSVYLGEKKKETAEKVLGTSLFLSLFFGALFTIFGFYYSDEILKLFGASDRVLPHASSYMKIVILNSIFSFFQFSLYCSIKSDGSPNYSMFMACFGAIINVILDFVFILILGFGVKGAAFATIISEVISLSLGVYYFLSSRSYIKLKLSNIRPSFLLKKIVIIGLTPFVIELFFSIQNAFLNIQLAKYGGDIAIAAMGIVFAAIVFIALSMIGVTDGMQPIVAYNFGAKKPKRIKEVLMKAILYSTVVGVVAVCFVETFPEMIASLFTDDKKLLEAGKNGLIIYPIFMFTQGIQGALSSYLPCVDKAKKATFYSIVRQVCIYLPLLYILPKYYGLHGVWLVMPVSDVISTIIALLWIRYEVKLLNKLED